MKLKEIFPSFKMEQVAPTLTREKIFSVLGGWALGKMDGVTNVSREGLVDLYEFAVEHAQQHRATMHAGGKPQ